MGIGPGYRRKSIVVVSKGAKDYTNRVINDYGNNPDPKNFKILKFEEIGNYTVLKVNYPNCTNFEGNKIMVYFGYRAHQLYTLNELDPHFSEDKISPIARFAPTELGWLSAVAFCVSLVDAR